MSDPDEYNKEFVKLTKEFIRIYSKILGEVKDMTDEELEDDDA